MNMQVQCVTVALPEVNEREVLRYARCDAGDEQVMALLGACEEEMRNVQARVCYIQLPCSVTESTCDFGVFSVFSRDLAKNLKGCNRAVLFAATLGMETDRLIARYQKISPAKAMLLQALGAERIESGCDAFCAGLERQGMQLKPRFSPGYGDADLSVQKDFFRVLQCDKLLGLYLNDSLLMSPSKSVTAFIGVEGE